MNLSRGAIHFHRLFSLRELAVRNCEPYTNRLIRKFLEIGEAVAARRIEMPRGILLLQMVPDKPDSGAVYLYDRQQEVFYLIWFDGQDDNLTSEEFNELLSEYRLVQYAEQPSRIHAQLLPAGPMLPDSLIETGKDRQETPRFVFLINLPCAPPRRGLQAADIPLSVLSPLTTHVWFQTLGSA